MAKAKTAEHMDVSQFVRLFIRNVRSIGGIRARRGASER